MKLISALTFRLAVEYEGGFDFGTFCEPHLVLSRFKAPYYDMILLDINMPILNGFQLFTQIRKIDEKVKICFIQHLLMCSLVTSREKESQSVNAECFIQKPIGSHELVRRIKAELSN